MYSVVLMVAATSGGDMASFGGRDNAGCHGTVASAGCSGGGFLGLRDGGGLFKHKDKGGCTGAPAGCTGTVWADPAPTGCSGHSSGSSTGCHGTPATGCSGGGFLGLRDGGGLFKKRGGCGGGCHGG